MFVEWIEFGGILDVSAEEKAGLRIMVGVSDLS